MKNKQEHREVLKFQEDERGGAIDRIESMVFVVSGIN